MLVCMFSWVALVTAAPEVAVVVLLEQVSGDATLEVMDSMCRAKAGPTFQALVCTSSQDWQPVLSASPRIHTTSGQVGWFSSLFGAIKGPKGEIPEPATRTFTGCDIYGSLDGLGSCQDWNATSGNVAYGMNDGLDSWLHSGVVSCAELLHIYCISNLDTVTVWTTRVPVFAGSVEFIDEVCRGEDYGFPQTYALVCRQGVDWPANLQGETITHKFNNWIIGPDALTPQLFQLNYPVMTMEGDSPTVLTGCNLDFQYQDADSSCQGKKPCIPPFVRALTAFIHHLLQYWSNFSGDAVAFSAPGSPNWISSGSVLGNCGSSHFYCIRLRSLETLPPTLWPTPSPTTSPTSAPTLPPTLAPTLVPTTAPTTTAPTLAPIPTTVPSTVAPTSLPPSTAVPTTRAPSTARPTSAVIVVTNFTGNATQNVTVPGNGADVTVILPSSLFQYGNSTSSVVIGKSSLNDVVHELLGGDSVVSIEVIVDGQTVDVMDLAIPVEFVIPRPAAACKAQLAAPAKCVWWDTHELVWKTDNCTTTSVSLADGIPATRCTCNHLTDFAVLLDRAAHCTKQFDERYLVFVVIYAAIILCCLIVVGRLQVTCDRSTRFLRSQHSVIGAVALVRMLSCLRFYGMLGDDLVLEGTLTALPYLIELWIFTRLASTWLGLVEFTMLSSELRWEKMRPWLYGINVVGSLFVVALFVAFMVELDYTTALVGTIGIASVYVILALAFLYYSSRLVTTMSTGASLRNSSNVAAKKSELCSPSVKILLAGRASAFCFLVQAVSSVLALVLERELIAAFTIIYLTFNCLALLGLLLVYRSAVAKAFRPEVAFTASDSQRSG